MSGVSAPMVEASEEKGKAAAWAKGGVAAVLAGILALLAGQEFLASGQAGNEGPIRSAHGPAAPAKSAANLPTPEIRISLEEALARDPFRMPMAIESQIERVVEKEKQEKQNVERKSEKGKTSSKAQTLARLKQDGVKMIVETSRGRAALIGDRIVHEGDKIDGFVVVRITRDGIDLESDTSQP